MEDANKPRTTGIKLERKEWLQSYGFNQDPFESEAVRAESDPLLGKALDVSAAFEPFPYYEGIKGKPDVPGPRFIFAPRGGGKTALKQQLEREFNDNLRTGIGHTLCVSYDNFDRVLAKADHDCSKVLPRYHVEEIIRLIVRRLFDILLAPDMQHVLDNLKQLDKKNPYHKKLLSWYVTTFGNFHEWEINKLLGRIQGMGGAINVEKVVGVFKETLSLAADVALPSSGAQLVTKLMELISTGSKALEVKTEDIQMVDLLSNLVEIICSLGFQNVYILVDEVDEPQYYGSNQDFQPAYELIRSLAGAPKILGVKNLVFKFFLPIEIRKKCLTSLRLDKFSEQVIQWRWKDLQRIYRRRLEVCTPIDSVSRLGSLSLLCTNDWKGYVDEWLVDFAKEVGSPRAIIFLGNELLKEHFRDGVREPEEEKDRISAGTFELARRLAEEVLIHDHNQSRP